MPLKALIFDVDGTLAETEREGHRGAFNDAFAAHGLDWFWGEKLYGELLAVGGGKERLEAYVASYLPKRPAKHEELIKRVYADKTSHYKRRIKEGHVDLRPGISRLIDEARAAGLKLAVATNSSIHSLTALTKKHMGGQPGEIFDVLVTGEDLREKKPDPHAYELALERLGVTAEECIAFEDSNVGLRAAAAVGIPTVVTVSSYTKAEDFSGAIWIMSDLGEPEAPADQVDGHGSSHVHPESHVDVDALVSLWESLHGS